MEFLMIILMATLLLGYTLYKAKPVEKERERGE